MKPLSVTLIQMCSGLDPALNLAALSGCLEGVATTDLVLLPEVCMLRGGNEDIVASAAAFPNSLTRELGKLARRRGVYILAGSLPERDGKRRFNTAVLFNRQGGIDTCYRKMNLFECLLPDGDRIRESDVYEPGLSPALCSVDGWMAGLSICYDIRFPRLYGEYAVRGAMLMLIPSDFTALTGRAHWHVLVRARAIETQSYVLAVNQCGANERTGVVAYGHSLVVSPWGEILAEAGEAPAVLTATIEPRLVEEARAASPVIDRLRRQTDSALR